MVTIGKKIQLIFISILFYHTSVAQSFAELQVNNFLDGNYQQSLVCYDSLLKKKFVPLENHKIALAAIDQLENSSQVLNPGFTFSKQDVIANIDKLENGSFADNEDDLPGIHTGEIFKKSKVNCSEPFNFSQGCPSKSPRDKISILDEKFKIAGSEDGHIIWIKIPKENNIGEHLLSALESDRISTNSPYNNIIGIAPANVVDTQAELNRKSIFAFRSIFSLFAKNEISVLEIHTILDKPGSSRAATVGFIMELDGDGYSVLKNESE